MRTFPAAIFSRVASRRHLGPRGGFSLLELLAVLLLMGLLLGIGLPAFQNMLQGGLQREVKRLTGILRLLRNEAVLTRTPFQLIIDLDGHAYRVEEEDPDGELIPRDDPAEFRRHELPSGFELQEFELFGQGGQVIQNGEVGVRVDSSGFMDPFLLRFIFEEKPYTLRVATLAGRLDLEEGHLEENQVGE